ncbi:MAG: metallopeptidase family protein [Oscillospiraceae bacterium]|nr:metallopeptidase family protein [Oscillospiraceae bacterium]
MYTIDDVEQMLNDIADEIPDEFFKYLNGGVILLEECKPHPQGLGDLYIMGQYHNSREMGRHICIYYGSFMRVHGGAPEDVLREKLQETLLHEFTHHLESLSGERGLEIKDRMKLNEYRHIHRRGEP